MTEFSKVLIANRGEIAVRVIRAARDEGLSTVAVYADPDRDAMHVTMADEAYSLGGATAADSYLVVEKLLEAARATGADAVHPGYGFLSENADFARAVTRAGLTWIGPTPEAIETLGDKVSARQLAEKVGAPMAPGTKEPVKSAKEVIKFADKQGLPIAIKAAHGGGGRGIKVVREHEEIVELYDSAVREATAAFGRGECFIERFLDAPRHVETQCLADEHGNVVVVSTRDCSLQRRNQKLVEEAPAPFLNRQQNRQLYRASKAILREAGYTGAGTCEFLVGRDGTISFLEVNTRLQVEHPVSEEVTGIDLVREQFRIARGERLGYDDPEIRGHSIEFRINGEDAGRNFMPAPGKLERFDLPTGPGVRVDSGVRAGETISGAFDSMVAKLIVTGATRAQAVQRARRALAEMTIEGMPTVLPFHRRVLEDPAFVPELAAEEGGHGHRRAPASFSVHTRWIETEFDNTIPPYNPLSAHADPDHEEERASVVMEVNGKRVTVGLPASLAAGKLATQAGRKRRRKSRSTAAAGASGDQLTSPMQGTIVKVQAKNGDKVAEGDLILVLEAMKMEQPLTAHKAGKIKGLKAEPGASVGAGEVLATIEG
ncbi:MULTISPECIES: acetyl/propionyl/methylcrotonyl-CoA carboxylase subunit alpha [Nesterenkonia]|uniref:biotin carboxylase n=1 Tax=Nesterenkonia xinjiangensis TaxID=225327 RepID=A0A7Z0K9K6_9MICC|nr:MULTISPECIES: biotin carboxylase N-terminal domain-containing protein [Nesterenkonia]MDZ5076613.1 ATP-grasp domain-containing protein [Nesterenkonia sp. HG001]NYJ77315.1 acetyl-CoA/propionyl-CoA carboxylase biotin carboxyl carrier protein [Nesterenkonia xinjiangensis]